MSPTQKELASLSKAIADGVSAGNDALLQSLTAQADKRHELRDKVQTTVDKVWEIDGELKLLKGIMVSLVGSGDGSTGMVPRLETDLKTLGGDVAEMKSEMNQLGSDVRGIRQDIATIMTAQSTQKSWTDGWKGVGVAVSIIAAALTAIGAMLTGMIWLFQHGVKP